MTDLPKTGTLSFSYDCTYDPNRPNAWRTGGAGGSVEERLKLASSHLAWDESWFEGAKSLRMEKTKAFSRPRQSVES